MFLDQGLSVGGDYVDVHNVQGVLRLTVMGYPTPMQIAVTQGGLELSLDQNHWSQSDIFDFGKDLQVDVYIRAGDSSHGTVSVLELEQ